MDPAKQLDTVVFDFGNVLVEWDPRLGFPNRTPAEVDRFFAEFDFAGFNHFQDAGRSIADGVAAVRASDPKWVPWLLEYFDGYPNTLVRTIPGTFEIVSELKAAGVRLYGLTNWWEELYHHAEEYTPAIRLLDGVVVSGYEKVAKPDPRLYRILTDRFGFTPEQAVFVDDRADNVVAANELGFHGLLFTDAPTLRQQLHALGLPIALLPTAQ